MLECWKWRFEYFNTPFTVKQLLSSFHPGPKNNMWSARIARQLGSAAVHCSMSTVRCVASPRPGGGVPCNTCAPKSNFCILSTHFILILTITYHILFLISLQCCRLAAATAGSEGVGEVHVYDLNAGAVSDAPWNNDIYIYHIHFSDHSFFTKGRSRCPFGGSGNGGGKDGILSAIRGISRRCTCN